MADVEIPTIKIPKQLVPHMWDGEKWQRTGVAKKLDDPMPTDADAVEVPSA